MINKILLSIKMQFRVPISVFFSLIFPIIMMLVIIMSYGNFNIGNGRHFIVKSRLLCKMLYNVFTISTYQN